jgi:hypothetical protein
MLNVGIIDPGHSKSVKTVGRKFEEAQIIRMKMGCKCRNMYMGSTKSGGKQPGRKKGHSTN